MAINNGRYVITWWYMNPDGTIVEEKQYVPGVASATPAVNTVGNYQYFPMAETYGLQSNGYADQWNTAMANAYWTLASGLWRYANSANNMINAADATLNYIKSNEAGLQWAAWNLYNNLVWGMQNQYDYINKMFGPQWELTQEVNKYYDDLWNYLATDAGRQAATIAAQWMHSWASLGAIRAQQNEAYNESFGRYIKAKEQQINAKQEIASNLINYMSALREEYWDTTNKYIIELYKRANDMYNSVAQDVANDIRTYNNLTASSIWTGWSTGWWTSGYSSSNMTNWNTGGNTGNNIEWSNAGQNISNTQTTQQQNQIVTNYDNPEASVDDDTLPLWAWLLMWGWPTYGKEVTLN